METASPGELQETLTGPEERPPASGEAAGGLIREIWSGMKLMMLSLMIMVLVHQYVFHLSPVRGISMQPTLQDGQWLFVNQAFRYMGTPVRGDVLVIKKRPEDQDPQHPLLVKRVVAVAGDVVHIRGGRLFVNDEQVNEPYTTQGLIEEAGMEPRTVEPGHLFVMGDNRRRYASYDSRSFGTVALSQVQGKAEWIVWPLRDLQSL